MKIYLAARYGKRLELLGYRNELEKLGHKVTSRWLNGKHQISDKGEPIGNEGEKLVESNDDEAAKLRLHFAQEDFADVLDSDTVISFTELPRSTASRGGRHVEFGIALALNKRLIVIGHRENIFHWLPSVEFYPTWEQAKRSL